MMPLSLRKLLLRGNAVFLLAASAGGMINDLTGAFLLRGPVGLVLEKAPHAAIGFVRRTVLLSSSACCCGAPNLCGSGTEPRWRCMCCSA